MSRDQRARHPQWGQAPVIPWSGELALDGPSLSRSHRTPGEDHLAARDVAIEIEVG
jgi:hypothetical protein